MSSRGQSGPWAFLGHLPCEQGLGLLCSVFGLFGLLLIPFRRRKDSKARP